MSVNGGSDSNFHHISFNHHVSFISVVKKCIIIEGESGESKAKPALKKILNPNFFSHI